MYNEEIYGPINIHHVNKAFSMWEFAISNPSLTGVKILTNTFIVGEEILNIMKDYILSSGEYVFYKHTLYEFNQNISHIVGNYYNGLPYFYLNHNDNQTLIINYMNDINLPQILEIKYIFN